MSLVAYIAEALELLRRNPLRSILSVLGILIGTAAVIAILGVSAAASGAISDALAAGGDPGYAVASDSAQDNPAGAALQYRDAAALAARVQNVSRVIPVYANRVYSVVWHGAHDDVRLSSSDGSDTTLRVTSGRKLNADDLLTGARVCIVSVSAAKAIFGGQSPIGESIHVGANRLTVVGVFDPEGGTLLNSIIGDAVIAPYTTVHDTTAGPVDFLQFWLVDRSKQSESYDALTRSLKERHEPRSAYIIQDESQTLSAFNLVLLLVTACLAAIGAVSLLVAGIGIMNIMLVTVNERMREIGIRRAVGATRRAIVTQFLVESVVLSACGGAIGIALGLAVVALVASVIRQQLGSAPVPYVPLVTGSVGVLVMIGVLSGTYPALRASRMNPIDVLSQ